MKNLLLILLALIVTPAWAADKEGAPVANPPASISLAQAEPTPVPAPDPATPDSTTITCPTGCTYMACPPPNGPAACCKRVGSQYQVCP